MAPPDTLATLLRSFAPGPIAAGHRAAVERQLAESWATFEGSDAGGMEAYKLNDRTEQLMWTPPVLSFRIERHGGTVLGSSRAEIQTWEVDLDRHGARLLGSGWRQVRSPAPKLDVTALAVEPQQVVLGEAESADGRLRLYPAMWPMPVVSV